MFTKWSPSCVWSDYSTAQHEGGHDTVGRQGSTGTIVIFFLFDCVAKDEKYVLHVGYLLTVQQCEVHTRPYIYTS